jgi:predicted O-methyltransferase YrrM
MQAFRHRRAFPIPAETWAIVDSIGGFLSRKEAGLLHWVACAWPVAGPVLELGAYEGRSTIVFASAGRQVHAVDAWSLSVNDLSAYGDQASADAVFERFLENLRRAGVESRVHPHRGLTHDVARRWNIPGAILFVDAGHMYADVKGDLELWAPHLVPGGVLLMHDVLGDVHLDVTRAASELLRQGWRVVASAGSIVAFARSEPQA